MSPLRRAAISQAGGANVPARAVRATMALGRPARSEIAAPNMPPTNRPTIEDSRQIKTNAQVGIRLRDGAIVMDFLVWGMLGVTY